MPDLERSLRKLHLHTARTEDERRKVQEMYRQIDRKRWRIVLWALVIGVWWVAVQALSAREYSIPSPEFRAKVKMATKDHPGLYYTMLGIASRESDFRPNLIGDGGNSYGAFQIHRRYHPELHRRYDLFDPYEGCKAALKILLDNLRRHGALNHAIAAYNCGSGGVNRATSGDPLNYDGRTTGKNYAKDVLQRAQFYIKLGL